MKMLTVLSAVALVSAGVQSSWAADYYAKNGGTIGQGAAIWYSAADPEAEPTATTVAGNNYWIVDGKWVNFGGTWYDYNLPGTLCIGGTPELCPWATSYSGVLQKGGWCNYKLHPTAVNWYNGTIRTDSRYAWQLSGVVNVLDGGANAIHDFLLQDPCVSVSSLYFPDGMKSVSEKVNVRVTVSNATTLEDVTAGYIYLQCGACTGYKGTITLDSANAIIRLGNDHALGDPNTPNPAALRVCNNGCVSMGTAHPVQSRNRGIRLDGAQAYFMSFVADGSTLDYPISRLDGAAGKLIKVRANDLTLDCAYSAGDIEVSAGRLIFSHNTTMPDGQKVLVRDGATLILNYAPGVGKLDVTTEGTGAVVYQDGYRQDADGNWEVRVRASATGDGTVSPTEEWVRPGEKVTFVATEGADAFCRWTGNVEAAGRGADVFGKTLTVEVSDVSPTLVANFGLPAKPADFTAADGTTYAFADRVLTITVPTDVTHAGEYAALVTDGYVTNIVKRGDGTLQLVAVSAYDGSFVFESGTVKAGAAGVFGKDGVGSVTMTAGTLNVTADGVFARGKRVFLAGTVNGGVVNNKSGFFSECDLKLVGTLTWVHYESNKYLELPHDSVFDLAGQQLKFSGPSYTSVVLNNLTVTNSDETTACALSVPSYGYMQFYGNTGFFGGSRNKISFAWDSAVQIYTKVLGDWTLNVNDLCQINTPANAANTTNYAWSGSLLASGTQTSYGGIRYNNATDGCLTFAGPVSGAGNMPIQGGIVNFLSSENTFSGKVTLLPTQSSKLRSCICVWDGAAFSAGASKPVEISNGDFWIGSNTAFRLPSYNHKSGTCRFYGGPSADKSCGRASLVNFTKSGDSTTLTVDSPVILSGKTDVQVGTLALSETKLTAAELPVFSNLVFAAGTAFDMHGNDLAVPNLTGFPTVSNAGELTIEGTWTIDYADILAGKALDLGAGKLAFAPGAKIVVLNRTATPIADGTVLARATGGVTGEPVVEGLRCRVEAKNGELLLAKRGMFLIVY